MEGAERADKESPLLQIDPRCLQDALRTFFQPIKTDDARVDFYTMYKREATEYDTDYVKKYDEDLNTTLIFAGLFSAVSSAFVIDVHSNLKPDPNEQSAALLRAILLTLNQSAIPGETPTIPPVQGDPPSEIVTVTCLMYASLMISLLAAFVAMLGKQWLNRYLRNSGGSMIERCGDRQRKCDGLEKWPLHFFVESLPVMLQAALLLLACGLCRHMWSINTSVACTLVSLTGLGVIFYIGIVIAGMSSYACPFQTPASITLRSSLKKIRHKVASPIVHYKWVFSRVHGMWRQGFGPLRRQSLSTIPLEDVQIQQSEPLPTLDNAPQFEPWLKSKDLAIIRRTNVNDTRCVSWILRNITDPEALDAAIRLAGEIRWFDEGVNVNPPYDLIVSTFEACFDSTRTLYPGSRDRAYYSVRAMMWIHTLARRKSKEFASTFPLPDEGYITPISDPDLEHLLHASPVAPYIDRYTEQLLMIDPGHTHPHSQWISNLLLHYSWANRTNLEHMYIPDCVFGSHETKTTIPLNASLNRLLALCTFLGSPVEEEALKVQDKSYRVGLILDQLSKAIPLAIKGTYTQRKFIQHTLRELIRLENHPERLTEIAYGWCSVMCEKFFCLGDQKSLLPVCLEIGFRHLDFRSRFTEATLTHTKHHRWLVDVVFKSREGEVIADLLHAWTTRSNSHEQAHTLLGFCARHLAGLHNLVSFSPRLRQLVIRSVEVIGYKGFKGIHAESFIGLLNHLHVTVKDIGRERFWVSLLLDTIQLSKRTQHLSHWYWELLAELAVSESRWLRFDLTHGLQTITSLTKAKEWSKLECWMGVVFMVLSWKANVMAEGDFGDPMLLLFRQRPGAVQKLERWMERWSQTNSRDISESFKQTCKQAHEAAQRDTLPILPIDKGAEGSARVPLSPVPSQPSGGNEFWESLPF